MSPGSQQPWISSPFHFAELLTNPVSEKRLCGKPDASRRAGNSKGLVKLLEMILLRQTPQIVIRPRKLLGRFAEPASGRADSDRAQIRGPIYAPRSGSFCALALGFAVARQNASGFGSLWTVCPLVLGTGPIHSLIIFDPLRPPLSQNIW
jgi:hypothetical protein